MLRLIPVAGIGLVIALFDGVRLSPAPREQQVLAVIVLAMVFGAVTLYAELPFVTTVLRVAGNGLKLWLVAWLSGWMVVDLEVQGGWTLVLAALVITVVNWFERLLDPPPPRSPDWPSSHHHLPNYMSIPY